MSAVCDELAVLTEFHVDVQTRTAVAEDLNEGVVHREGLKDLEQWDLLSLHGVESLRVTDCEFYDPGWFIFVL